MKYVGFVFKETWNDDDKSRKKYVEKSRPYDTIEEADKWIDDKIKENNEIYDAICSIYHEGIGISESTIIAIDDEKSQPNYNDILAWLAAYTLHD